MIFSDEEIRILAAALAKHTGEQFDLTAPDLRAAVGLAYLSIEDSELLEELQKELESRGVRIDDNDSDAEHLPPAEVRVVELTGTASSVIEDDNPSRGASASMAETIRRIRANHVVSNLSHVKLAELDHATTVELQDRMKRAAEELRRQSAAWPSGLLTRVSAAYHALRGELPVPILGPVSVDLYEEPAIKIFNAKLNREFAVVIGRNTAVVVKALTAATGSPREAFRVAEYFLRTQIDPGHDTSSTQEARRSLTH